MWTAVGLISSVRSGRRGHSDVIAHDIEVEPSAVAPLALLQESLPQCHERLFYGSAVSRKGKTGLPINSTSASKAWVFGNCRETPQHLAV